MSFGFLDYRTAEKRRAACEAEVELNARLAPGVYLGVVPVVCRVDGVFGFGGEGTRVDWAVHMRRMADEERVDNLLLDGALGATEIDAIADRLATFHAEARCDDETSAYGAPAKIAHNVRENFAQTRDRIDAYLRPEEAREIECFQIDFLRRKKALFADRVSKRRIRDGHGDLRLEHVYLDRDRAITILDCIEFNVRFRYADVCADLAFLAMDLAWHGRTDLAERLLARYALVSGDHDLYSVVDFYESYRAYVRGKVSAILASDEGAGEAARACARLEARKYFLLALAAPRRSLLAPILVCVGGVIASGKSTVASSIAAELGAPVIEADRVRKEMLGVAPTTPLDEQAWRGAYDPTFTDRVYAEVRRRAEVVVASGRGVVVDASFRSARERASFAQLARERGTSVRFIECVAERATCRRRLAERAERRGVSDGRLAIFDDFCARFEPFEEIAPGEHVRVQTSGPLDQALALVRAAVPTWPRKFIS